MKREGKDSTVLWWIGWIALTILSVFVSAWVWTGTLARWVGPMSRPGAPIIWVAAVFGTWLLLLLPLIIVMYNKVDRAYEDSRNAQEARRFERSRREMGVRAVSVPAAERRLAEPIAAKLRRSPHTIPKGHLVTALLRDGRRVPNVFIYDARDVLGVYDAERLDFKVSEIVDVIPAAADEPLTPFTADRWLRLDGIGGVPGA